jgi:hypothetical protein
MVSGCGKSVGFLDRIEQAFDGSAFEALAFADSRFDPRRARLSAACCYRAHLAVDEVSGLCGRPR